MVAIILVFILFVVFAVKVGGATLRRSARLHRQVARLQPTPAQATHRRTNRNRKTSSSSSSASSSSTSSSSSSDTDSDSTSEYEDAPPPKKCKKTPSSDKEKSGRKTSTAEEKVTVAEVDTAEPELLDMLPNSEEMHAVLEPEGLTTTTIFTLSDAETQTGVESITKSNTCSTQTSYTSYPKFIDNAGEIQRQLTNLRRALRSFQQRMSTHTLRSHGEARTEIRMITEKVRTFLTFHRQQVNKFLAETVLEGHRNAVKDNLRNKSNNAIFPVLELLDKLRDENLHLGAQYRAPLAAYGKLVEELHDRAASLEGLNNIFPPQFLS